MLARVPRRATARQGTPKTRTGPRRVALCTRSLFPLPLGGPPRRLRSRRAPGEATPVRCSREGRAPSPTQRPRCCGRGRTAQRGVPLRGRALCTHPPPPEAGEAARPATGALSGGEMQPDHAPPRTQARTSGTAAAANSREKKTCRRAGAEAPGGAARAIRALRAPLTHQRPVPALGGARGRAWRCNSRRSSAALQRTPGSPVYTSASLLQVDDTMSFSSQPSLLMAGAPATRAAKCPLRSEPAQHRTRPHRRDRDPRRGRRSAETL